MPGAMKRRLRGGRQQGTRTLATILLLVCTLIQVMKNDKGVLAVQHMAQSSCIKLTVCY